MEHELVVHLPINNFFKGKNSGRKTLQILCGKEHRVCAAKDPLVWRFVCLGGGVIGEGRTRRTRAYTFAETNKIPGASRGVCE